MPGIAAFGLLGVVLVVFPAILHGMMPGDIGDARLNEYLLEHFYQWVIGKVGSFWDGEFFYPFPHTIAFSDNYLGNGFIFAILRGVGLDREDAFRGWFLLGFVFNFAACAIALTRLGYGRLATACGAFFFAFGLPMTAQEAHSQLIYRFGVPLAALALIEFGERRRLMSLLAVVFWTVWQFYCSIYVGYFLSLLLAALGLSIALNRDGFSLAALTYWPSSLRVAWKEASSRGRVGWPLGILCLIGLLIALVYPYVQVSKAYGFRRAPSEIESMLPRLASYLYSRNSRLWDFHWSAFDALPMAHEQALFIGAAPILAIAVALMSRLRWSARIDRHFMPAFVAVLLLVALTLFVANHTLYGLLERAHGANAIRAVARIITVMLFPFAILLASGLDALMREGLIARGLAAAIAALLVVESSYTGHYVSHEEQWRGRLSALDARLPPTLPGDPILMVGPSPTDPPFAVEIDAMLLAQQRGWHTFDGYSASEPTGYAFSGDCEDAASNIVSGLSFLKRNTDEAYREMARRVVRVGYDDCDEASLTHRPTVSSLAGPLPDEAMAKTTVAIDGIRQSHGMIHVTIALGNNGSRDIPAISTTGMPVRLSAKYIGASDSVSDADFRNRGWDSRQAIVVDIVPGETRRVDMPIPGPNAAGTYRVAVSLVQDGVAWFHDRGMSAAVSRQTVTLDGAIEIGE